MKTARQLLAIWLGFALLAYAQGNSFNKIRYNGGTFQTSVKPKDWGNKLMVTSDVIRLVLKDGQVLDIDPARVTGLSYGQEAHRRVGTMVALGVLLAPLALFGLFHKTRLHYVGIEFTDSEGKRSGLLLQAHKKNFRAVLMALRGATGAPVAVAEKDRRFVPTGVETIVAKPEEAGKTETAETTEIPETPMAESGEAEGRSGVITITSTPDGAEVWVNGEFVGNTPAKLTLAAGKCQIRVSLPGYKDWEREVQIHPDSELTLKATFQQP